MNKKYIVRLSLPEKHLLEEVIKKLKGTSERVRRTQILLKADADGPTRRTKIDWAFEMEELLRTEYANAEKARKIIKRLEFLYTPKHGSWLNVSENKLS